ncbi:MAG: hypothetical protein A2822_02275 [Candidatus Staskawiczbacteria bacterium RIFCSPHIGHO2_01_FULL_41_41]|uniref:bAvd-like domain-containing protein n=1 Tax=Candidatus Staskawiczbacteria bacterium RIFCSPHIGHO2_01_FULL_41_41 TaxID=1802203 RepID=A0A1G2HUY4_9BACT|nr:MAG: hypothetical protein A2822_02275 [Candidatus Staskawiczbacteria bacterium RIFCSPHIGHO2_01_FULL_41_41]OGZ74421.1 MAG: hypothetical protein A3A12_01475 [Candidatus Staskawiczbacteria bacterium RIFCSPLOWO2_01_FULL_43_17b]
MPILRCCHELYKSFYEYSKCFPKKDKHNIANRCENIILDIIELILLAINDKTQRKLLILEKISAKLNTLRMFIRLIKELKIISLTKYIILQSKIDEIGIKLGIWIKNAQKQSL